jgi:hypothetical protein
MRSALRWPLFFSADEKVRALTALMTREAIKQERPLHPAPTTDWGNAAGYLDTSYYEKAG